MYDPGWSDDDTISAFLTYHRRPTGTYWGSSLIGVLRDARAATGRYLASGEVGLKPERSGSWLGAVGYMVMLDQIGECYRPANAGPLPKGTPDFIRALTYFAEDMPDPERQALYALRCCFVHDYSLVNIPTAGNAEIKAQRQHHFLLGDDPAPCPVVQLPAERWGGDLGYRPRRMATRVSLRRLGDLAESVYARLLDLHERRELRIALPGGAAELRARYAFMVYPDVRLVDE